MIKRFDSHQILILLFAGVHTYVKLNEYAPSEMDDGEAKEQISWVRKHLQKVALREPENPEEEFWDILTETVERDFSADCVFIGIGEAMELIDEEYVEALEETERRFNEGTEIEDVGFDDDYREWPDVMEDILDWANFHDIDPVPQGDGSEAYKIPLSDEEIECWVYVSGSGGHIHLDDGTDEAELQFPIPDSVNIITSESTGESIHVRANGSEFHLGYNDGPLFSIES